MVICISGNIYSCKDEARSFDLPSLTQVLRNRYVKENPTKLSVQIVCSVSEEKIREKSTMRDIVCAFNAKEYVQNTENSGT